MADETLALLRGVHARDGLEQRILARLDDRTRVPHPEHGEGWVPAFVLKTPFATAAFASAAFGAVAVAALGAAVFLAYSRPAPVVFVPAPIVGNVTPVLSHSAESHAVQAAGATAVAKSPIHPHTRGRDHRIGRAVHARSGLPRGATLPRQLDLHAPQPLALQR
ncbi:MAG: hypothetical protein ACR2JE_00850 [Acidobacteriaceae bacterium]